MPSVSSQATLAHALTAATTSDLRLRLGGMVRLAETTSPKDESQDEQDDNDDDDPVQHGPLLSERGI